MNINAYSLASDKTKTLYLASDRSQIDYKTGITVFIGHVKLDQGSTHLTGDKLIANLNAQHKIYKVVTFGNQAKYSTLQHPGEAIFHAEAKTLTYFPDTGQVYLDEKALTFQGNNKISGAHITYNTKKQQGIAKQTKHKRVTMVINPNNTSSLNNG
jgi:lipopolysaccharide export system protein LptA